MFLARLTSLIIIMILELISILKNDLFNKLALQFTYMQHLQINQTVQQSRVTKHQALVERFRRAYPPTTNAFSKFISYVKKVGSQVVNNLTIFSKLLKKQSKQVQNFNSKEQENKDQSQSKCKGKILDFTAFVVQQLQEGKVSQNMQDIKAQQQQNELSNKKMRLQFKADKINQDKKNINKSKDQDWQIEFETRMFTKRSKLNPVYENDQKLIQNIVKQPKQITRRLNQIFNKVTYDRAQVLLQARQIRERQEANKPQIELIEQIHQNYLKFLGLDNKKDGIKGSHIKLNEMMKKKREIIQKKPLRKRIHVQDDLPPMLQLQKVMETLQMQRIQFFDEKKKKKIQQEARIKRQMEKLEELEKQKQRKIEQQKKLRQQKQMQQSIRNINQQKQLQKEFVDAANQQQHQQNGIEISQKLHVIPHKIQRSQNQFVNGERQISSSSLQENNQKNNVIINSVQCYNSPIIQRKESNQLFSTPPKKVIQGLQQKIAQTLNQNQVNKNIIKQNPFTKPKTTTTTLNINDIINKNPMPFLSFKKQTQQQQLTTSTVGQAYFSPNQQGPNFFNPNKNQIPAPQINFLQNLNSPNKILHNPIQKTVPINIPPNNTPTLFNVSSPFSAVNQFGNSGNRQSNINSYSQPSSFSQPSQQIVIHSEPTTVNRPFISFLGNNPEAARMFDHNLFAANRPAETLSLFGPPSQPVNTNRQAASRNRKGKNQIRIN